MNGDLKTSFIHKSLAEYMQAVKQGMIRSAGRQKVGVTNESIATIAYAAATQGATTSASLSFADALRYVDMGVGRGHPLGGLQAVRQTLQASTRVGVVLKKDNTRKPKKIYSKVAYGNLTWLENKLLYGFTEETIAQMKKELEQKNTTTNV